MHPLSYSTARRANRGGNGGQGGGRHSRAPYVKRWPCDYSVYRAESMLRSRQALFVTNLHLVCIAPLNATHARNALSQTQISVTVILVKHFIFIFLYIPTLKKNRFTSCNNRIECCNLVLNLNEKQTSWTVIVFLAVSHFNKTIGYNVCDG